MVLIGRSGNGYLTGIKIHALRAFCDATGHPFSCINEVKEKDLDASAVNPGLIPGLTPFERPADDEDDHLFVAFYTKPFR